MVSCRVELTGIAASREQPQRLGLAMGRIASDLSTTNRKSGACRGPRYNPMSMAVFKADKVHDEQLDWIILRDGGVRLYWRLEILTDELNWLKSNGYKIIFLRGL